jgi:hypothetical protein
MIESQAPNLKQIPSTEAVMSETGQYARVLSIRAFGIRNCLVIDACGLVLPIAIPHFRSVPEASPA